MRNKAEREDVCTGRTTTRKEVREWEESDRGEGIKNSWVKELEKEDLLPEQLCVTTSSFFFLCGRRTSFGAACKHTLNEIKSLCSLGGLFSSLDFWGEATPPPVSPVTALLGPAQTSGEDGNRPHSTDSMLIQNSFKSTWLDKGARDVNYDSSSLLLTQLKQALVWNFEFYHREYKHLT